MCLNGAINQVPCSAWEHTHTHTHSHKTHAYGGTAEGEFIIVTKCSGSALKFELCSPRVKDTVAVREGGCGETEEES